MNEMKRQNVKLVLVEPYFDLKTPTAIGRETGADAAESVLQKIKASRGHPNVPAGWPRCRHPRDAANKCTSAAHMVKSTLTVLLRK